LNPCLQHIFIEADSDSKDGVVKGPIYITCINIIVWLVM
jgi:hypothetical protein